MLKRETTTRACSEFKCLRVIRRLPQESCNFQHSNIPQMAIWCSSQVKE